MKKVALIEPYYTGSHAAWADSLKQHSKHDISLFTLPGRFWKWRMHGGAVSLARQLSAASTEFDVIIASDMVDLSTFQALTRAQTGHTAYIVYFHENQLTYPFPPHEKRDLHYGFINYTTALAADRVLFNSAFHRTSFLEELPRLLKHFPDFNELETIEQIAAKSSVLPLGIDLKRLDVHQPAQLHEGPLTIIWNHRWEYDKQPETFFNALYALQSAGIPFRVIVVGESFRQRPEEFLEAEIRLAQETIHFGYSPAFDDYARFLWEADLQVSCAIQDFFGSSTVEAMYCNCIPLLPNRLNYPAFIPKDFNDLCLYELSTDLVSKLKWACQHVAEIRNMSLRPYVEQYDWANLMNRYDSVIDDVIKKKALR